MAQLNIKHIPNILTIFRIILIIPIIVFAIISNLGIAYSFNINGTLLTFSINNLIILILFVIASISDWLDGYLSRKYHWVSDFGKILDPIADKILINTLFIIISVQNYAYFAFTILFIARDTIVDGVRMFAASKKIIIPANIWGKLKTILQMIALILVLLIGNDLTTCVNLLWWYWGIQQLFVYVALVVSCYSGINYVWLFVKSQSKLSV